MYERYFKRIFDVVLATFGLIVLSPFLLIIAIWIKLSSKGSLFYMQKRVGLNFKEFDIYKFRSMVVNAEGPSVTSVDDPRITKVGKFLRRTKIDELPQLLNVMKSDMSLVGPRPEVMKFVEQKKDEYKKVLRVRPGITDNAAIAFRNEESMLRQYEDKEKAYVDIILPQKMKFYNNYADNISFMNDIKLILQTLKVI